MTANIGMKCSKFYWDEPEPLSVSAVAQPVFYDTAKKFISIHKGHVLNSDAAFSVAIYGDWGSGKTTMMKCLQRAVEQEKGTTIWFEPWRFENEPNLMAPLLSEMVAVTSSRLKEQAMKDAAVKTGKKLFGRIAKATFRTGAGMAARMAGIDAKELERIGSDFAEFYTESGDEFTSSPSETAAFRDDFSALIRLAGMKPARKTLGDQTAMVCIFIDDLDRCAPVQVVRLLEAIKVFLWTPGVTFFLALDQEQILNALLETRAKARVERDMTQAERYKESTAYLEKFFLYSMDVGVNGSIIDESDFNKIYIEIYKEFSEAMNSFNATWLKIQKSKDDPAKKSHCVAAYKYFYPLRISYYVSPNLRKLKRVVRWLYFELAMNPSVTKGVSTKLAETIIAENYPPLWIGLLKAEPAPVRAAVYAQIVVLCAAVRRLIRAERGLEAEASSSTKEETGSDGRKTPRAQDAARDLADIHQLLASGAQRQGRADDAVEALIGPDGLKQYQNVGLPGLCLRVSGTPVGDLIMELVQRRRLNEIDRLHTTASAAEHGLKKLDRQEESKDQDASAARSDDDSDED